MLTVTSRWRDSFPRRNDCIDLDERGKGVVIRETFSMISPCKPDSLSTTLEGGEKKTV